MKLNINTMANACRMSRNNTRNIILMAAALLISLMTSCSTELSRYYFNLPRDTAISNLRDCIVLQSNRQDFGLITSCELLYIRNVSDVSVNNQQLSPDGMEGIKIVKDENNRYSISMSVESSHVPMTVSYHGFTITIPCSVASIESKGFRYMTSVEVGP